MDGCKCPDCGAELIREDWWDDTPENGGACIGYILTCEECKFIEYN